MTPLQYLYRARHELRVRQVWLAHARTREQRLYDDEVVRHHERLVCEALDDLWAAQQWYDCWRTLGLIHHYVPMGETRRWALSVVDRSLRAHS